MKTAKPNAIWILCDQLRAQALSCGGDPNITTPNIDQLARTGVHFTQAVSGTPLCCPYRGSLLTGLYPHRCVPGHEDRMPPEQTTIANVFRENGYHTAYVGKWHLDGFKEKNGRAGLHIVPQDRRGGFDYWMGYENNNSQWDCWVHGGDASSETPPVRLPGYETDALTDLFLDHLDHLPFEQPFFGVLSVQPPHDPYVAPADVMSSINPQQLRLRGNVPDIDRIQEQARRELAGAYAMIRNLDDNIGRVVRWLRDTGRYENTHIIFFSDHGDMHGSHGMFRKTNPFEESVRVPLIISGCQATYDGYLQHQDRHLVNHVDMAPTTLGLCGIDAPDFMQGHDYSPQRLSWRSPHEYPDSAFLQLVVPTGHADSTEFAWRGIISNDGYKFVSFAHMPWLLFNLNEDPLEQVNLAHNSLYAGKRRELTARLRRWIDETGDDFPLMDEG